MSGIVHAWKHKTPNTGDGPHCGTWNPWGGVGSRSNSSHLTYT